MRKGAVRNAAMALALFASAHSANAHGIAENWFFVGTLTFDDPSVADEAVLSNFSTLSHSVEGGSAVDNRFYWSFTRLLTPVLQVQVDSGWIDRNDGADLGFRDDRCGHQKRSVPQQPT